MRATLYYSSKGQAEGHRRGPEGGPQDPHSLRARERATIRATPEGHCEGHYPGQEGQTRGPY